MIFSIIINEDLGQIIEVLYEYSETINVNECFGFNDWCGCTNDSVLIGLYGEDMMYISNLTDDFSINNDSIHYLTKMKCAKPVDMIIDTCEIIDITSTFGCNNYNTTINCPEYSFIQSIKANGDMRICEWEQIRCCNFKITYKRDFIISNVTQNNWRTCMNNEEGWCDAASNTFITGLYKGNGNQLNNLEYAYSQSMLLLQSFACK